MRKLGLLLSATLLFTVRMHSQAVSPNLSPLPEGSRNAEIFFHTGQDNKSHAGTEVADDADNSGFQLTFRHNRISDVITGATNKLKFTAGTTEDAAISIRVGDETVASTPSAKSLVADYTFTGPGDYVVTAEAVAGGATLTRSITVVYARDSAPAADTTVPAMGLTRNADGSSTFCLAAPGKESVMLVGSWNGYRPTNGNVMEYVDTDIDGNTFRFFKTTLPAGVTGSEFCYYYLVEGRTSVGDPYARLVLDPQNDKYIPADVFPGLPEYPADKVPDNTSLAYHRDGMFDYEWTSPDFKAPAKTDLVIYEMLFRDFTGTEGQARGNGTVRAAIEKIPYLKELGINAVELLPINEFNGNNSWGYNPNFYFAPDKAYGTPQDYKEFIDLCHKEGIAVILDVVFNQSDWQHPWFRMYPSGSNPFFNATAPHAYSVLNDWNQGHPLVQQQWTDALRYWMEKYNADGFRFDLVKGLGDNDSYTSTSGTDLYNQSRVDRMARLHAVIKSVKPDGIHINENLAGAKEETAMGNDGQINWANINNASCQYAMGYESDSDLSRFLATADGGRPAGSTIAYAESHDEERVAFKVDAYAVASVKADVDAKYSRLGALAVQMLLTPGPKMVWQFGELANNQTTKHSDGSNNTDPKIVDWGAWLSDSRRLALHDLYSRLVNLRRNNPELFALESEGGATFTTSGLSGAYNSYRYLRLAAGGKEVIALINPSPTAQMKVSAPASLISYSDHELYAASAGYSDNLTGSGTVSATLPANGFAVFVSKAVSAIDSPSSAQPARARGGHGIIIIDGSYDSAAVYDIAGRRLPGLEAPAGVYIVDIDGARQKVTVR